MGGGDYWILEESGVTTGVSENGSVTFKGKLAYLPLVNTPCSIEECDSGKGIWLASNLGNTFKEVFSTVEEGDSGKGITVAPNLAGTFKGIAEEGACALTGNSPGIVSIGETPSPADKMFILIPECTLDGLDGLSG